MCKDAALLGGGEAQLRTAAPQAGPLWELCLEVQAGVGSG